MNKQELLEKLRQLSVKSEIYAIEPFKIDGDPMDWHEEADMLLLEYIDDKEIEQAFKSIERWYS